MSATQYTDIRAALTSRLTALADKPTVIWENTAGNPIAGVPHIEPELLMGEPAQATIGTDGLNEELGVYQITLCNYPKGVGTGAILAAAGIIRDWFKRGTPLTYNGVRLMIRKAYIGRIDYNDPTGLRLPITIAFYTQVAN